MSRPFSKKQTVIRIKLAVASVIVGLAVLASLFITQDFPADILVWAMFATAFVYLEFNAVEVNDRLLASPTVMVALTAAVVFGSGRAILGVVSMTALAFLTGPDIKEREWFRPAVNFGQLVVTAALSMTVLEFFLPADGIHQGNIWVVALGSGLAAMVHGAVNLNLVLFIVRLGYGRRSVRPWSRLGAIAVPYLGMGFLGGLLGVTYQLIGPVALPLIFIVFFVGHMTFASYAELREAQESTLRGFIKALEAKDLYTRGHTERVAYFAQMIGEEMGFSGTRLERLRWAALIHDVGKLAVPRELIRKKAALTSDEYSLMQSHVHHVEALLSEVEFLQPMVEIASKHHVHYDGNGYHGSSHAAGDHPGTEACILAVADSFDAMTSTRSYRVALSQDYAFAELRRNGGSQFAPHVVEAFIGALNRRGETYGSADVRSDEEARRRAEGVPVRG